MSLTLPTKLSAEPITSNELGRRSAGLPGKECDSLVAPAWPFGSLLTTETDNLQNQHQIPQTGPFP